MSTKLELYPYLIPKTNPWSFFVTLRTVNILRTGLALFSDFKIEGDERFRAFQVNHPEKAYSYIAVSNHIGEIETFAVPMVMLNQLWKSYGPWKTYRNKYHILAKEELFGEKDIHHITKEKLRNQKLDVFGRYIRSVGALKYMRHVPLNEKEGLYPHHQIDILIDEIINKKRNIVVFPEGHRMNRGTKKRRAGPLLAYIAAYAEAPIVIVPIYIDGDFRLREKTSKRRSLHFSIREPYVYRDKEGLRKRLHESLRKQARKMGLEIADRFENIPRDVALRLGYRHMQAESKQFVMRIYE